MAEAGTDVNTKAAAAEQIVASDAATRPRTSALYNMLCHLIGS
jgi:hypothetical protein